MISSGMSSKNFLPQFMVFGLGVAKLHLGSKMCASFTLIVHYKFSHTFSYINIRINKIK